MNSRSIGILVKGGLVMAITLMQLGCSVVGIRSEETPKYEVLLVEGDKEIRSYTGYIVAKTKMKGDFKEVQGDSFRILANYIFGNNEKKQKISMTAPVSQEKTSESEKIAMTAPVTQTLKEDSWEMTFSMPSEYKMADLPTPNDNRVTLEEVPPKFFGVIRYSGLGRKSTNDEMAKALREWLNTKPEYEIVGGPSYAGYDPPWTIPFLRRNEMMFEVRRKNEGQ